MCMFWGLREYSVFTYPSVNCVFRWLNVAVPGNWNSSQLLICGSFNSHACTHPQHMLWANGPSVIGHSADPMRHVRQEAGCCGLPVMPYNCERKTQRFHLPSTIHFSSSQSPARESLNLRLKSKLFVILTIGCWSNGAMLIWWMAASQWGHTMFHIHPWCCFREVNESGERSFIHFYFLSFTHFSCDTYGCSVTMNVTLQ